MEEQMSAPYFPVDMSEMKAHREFHDIDEGRLALDDVHVKTMWLNHPQGCMGFRLETKDGVLVYATDNEPGDAVFDKNVRKLADRRRRAHLRRAISARRIRSRKPRLGTQPLARSGERCDGKRRQRTGAVPPRSRAQTTTCIDKGSSKRRAIITRRVRAASKVDFVKTQSFTIRPQRPRQNAHSDSGPIMARREARSLLWSCLPRRLGILILLLICCRGLPGAVGIHTNPPCISGDHHEDSVPCEQEINPWEAQAARFDLAAKKLNLDEGLWKVLRYPNREIIVHIPVQMDDGRIEVFTGYRVQHSIARGPRKAASATRPTSPSTKCAPWPAG